MGAVRSCPRPSNQAVQRTPLARFMGLGAIHVPSGAANRHVGRAEQPLATSDH